MAIVRDNRGALLASNLSKYIAGAANTAGTPIDTNEMVKIGRASCRERVYI